VSSDDAEPEQGFCSYETFGLRFFQHAVTVERITDGVSGLTGKPIEFGPLGAGPAKIAKVHATGRIGEPRVDRMFDDEPLRFRLNLPVDLRFTVSLPGTENRFTAEVDVELRLTARAAEPLRIVIDIDPPERKDVTVQLRSEGIASTVLSLVSGMDYELKRFLARYIGKEIDKPHIRQARDVDLIPMVQRTAYRPGSG
jgi:hypothetical protein